MEVINQHINKHIAPFIKSPTDGFEEIFSKIVNSEKERLKKLLIYVDRILNINATSNNSEINYLHLHIEKDFDFNDRTLILDFLVLKHFLYSLDNDKSEIVNELIQEKISRLKRDIINNQIPANASGRNGGNRIYKNWKSKKDEKKAELNFNKTILYSDNLQVYTLVNTLTRYFTECIDKFKSKQYVIKIEDVSQKKSYVAINKQKTLDQILNQIDQNEQLVDNLENIILFDSESKSSFINFNLKELLEWNGDGTTFKKLLIITFGKKKVNINNLKNKLNQVDFKFNTEKNELLKPYVITNYEVNKLIKIDNQKQLKTNFYGIESNTFWDSFLLETQIHENLYELISIKMRNIYSLVINEEIKEIVLESIFGGNEGTTLISETTQQEFPDELKNELKENLSNTLDYIIYSSWKDEIKKLIHENTTIVISNEFLENNILKKELQKELGLSHSNKLINWEELNSMTSENLLILNYLDPGHYPYYFYPNIIEIPTINSKGIFLNLLFKNKFQWANYNNNNDYYKLLNHQVRSDYFDWIAVKNKVNSLRPKVKEKTSWDIESTYVNNGNKEVIRIKLLSEKKPHNYQTSDLFIYKSNDTNKVVRAIDLLALNPTEIQSLDYIINALPIYDKLADINKQEEELDVIRKKFNIEDGEDAGRLWKVLLKRKSEDKGKESLYSEIQELLGQQNLKMVSFQHFENHWINPESKSLAPIVKKVFLSICNYLNLPKTYIILISRIKNKTKQTTRNNTRKMNLLFKDLFDDGCFDDISKTREILITKKEYYQKNHSLEELGIDENHLLENLVALVELINPEISLQKVDSIESINL
ncbi:hypothetical protein H9W90_07985 [Polaribacter pectinis]|uniref:Uncharacterized protein n=1 Tax=Polaribacter pectinis TaxID=2738844 RepID=A0A7G9L6A3_9FLAO|nr:hypothetical protein [Polaribacter pectinis]QNM84152.1 hypothetical protein H9W90_07985 [Polaribacter pectinis]